MASLAELKNELVEKCELIVNYKFDNQDIKTIKAILKPIVEAIAEQKDNQKKQRRWRN